MKLDNIFFSFTEKYFWTEIHSMSDKATTNDMEWVHYQG